MRSTPFVCALGVVAIAGSAHAANLRLALNHSTRLPLAGPAASVVIGNPGLVDVSVVDSRTVFVSAKAPGATDVTVIDPLGRIVYRGDIVVASGAAVSIFSGAKQEVATCSPFCRTVAEGDASATMATGAPPTGAMGGVAPIANAVSGLNAGTASGVGAVGAALSPR